MMVELKDLLGDDFTLFLTTFVRDLNIRCEDIAQAVLNQDADALRQVAHSLKGSASNVGAECLTKTCSLLEDLSMTGQFDGASELVVAVEKAQKDILDELKKLA